MLILAVTAKAQTPLSFGAFDGTRPAFRHFHHGDDSNYHQKKWFVTKTAGISTGFVGFRGGSGYFISAPVGLQLNRQLTNNVYAFAGVAVAPTYFSFNNSFFQPGVNKGAGSLNANNFTVNPAAYVGLMYVNPDKTFSISGSIGVSSNSYNGYGYYPSYNPAAPGFRNNNIRHFSITAYDFL